MRSSVDGAIDASAATARSASTLSDGDAAAMAELLSHEHPQIVAAALSRLGDEQSAAVFAALPPELQAEALERLASLAPADEDAVQEVESQLQHRLQQRREHQARSAAGAELVAQDSRRARRRRSAWCCWSGCRRRTPAATRLQPRRLGVRRTAGDSRVARQARPSTPSPNRPSICASAVAARTAPPMPHAVLEDRSDELELLSDEALVAALRQAGEQTVLRALAASGETSSSSASRDMLPRRQARKLRRMLARLGPDAAGRPARRATRTAATRARLRRANARRA